MGDLKVQMVFWGGFFFLLSSSYATLIGPDLFKVFFFPFFFFLVSHVLKRGVGWPVLAANTS